MIPGSANMPGQAHYVTGRYCSHKVSDAKYSRATLICGESHLLYTANA
jgi:hypothetical protein